MPFFQSAPVCRNYRNDPYAAESYTLQVRMPGGKRNREMRMQEGKGVWIFSSGVCRQASVSVEAALSLSIFIFAMVCMMFPFRMMERQRQVQAALESVNENLCQYAYLEYMLMNGEELPREDSGWKEELLLGIVNGAAREGAKVLAGEKFSHSGMKELSFDRSAFLEDGETAAFYLDYQMELPFSILGLDALSFSSGSIRRAWIGRDGKTRGEEDKAGEGSDQVVYVGKNSTRYHVSRECHYLSNRLQTVSEDSISEYRNQEGGKYYPCAVCGHRAGAGSKVYIMANGSRYHTDAQCSAITSYIRAVKLSEVEHLGACSYCGR